MAVNDELPDFVLIDGNAIDVAISEEHVFDSEITSYPVESSGTNGTNFIADNVRIKPMTVSLEGIVSDSPIGAVAALRDDPSSAPNDAYRRLLKIRADRKPVTITTSLDSYSNMILTSLSVPRGPGGASYLQFRAKFEQVDFVTNDKSVTTIPTARTPVAKTASPTPLAKTAYNTGLFRMIRLTPTEALWFDDAIGGWRYTGELLPTSANWLFTRDMPYGVDEHFYETTHPPDSYYKSLIQDQNASGESFNPYDPFQNPILVANGMARSIQTVGGLIVDSTGN